MFDAEPARFDDLVIDRAAWEVRRGDTPVPLTKTEFLLLALLSGQPRRVITGDEITRAIWGEHWIGDDGNIAVHVSNLRKKLGESGLDPRFIRTVRGVGYRFDPPGSAEPLSAPPPGGQESE